MLLRSRAEARAGAIVQRVFFRSSVSDLLQGRGGHSGKRAVSQRALAIKLRISDSNERERIEAQWIRNSQAGWAFLIGPGGGGFFFV